MHHASSYNMYIKQQDVHISMIKLYFPLDALHVSDYISPSSGATFISRTSHSVYADTTGCCVSIFRSNFYKLYIAFGISRYMPIRLAVV